MKAFLLAVLFAVALVACSNKSEAGAGFNQTKGDGHYSTFTVTMVRAVDGTQCYVATESGHGLAMQCNFSGAAK